MTFSTGDLKRPSESNSIGSWLSFFAASHEPSDSRSVNVAAYMPVAAEQVGSSGAAVRSGRLGAPPPQPNDEARKKNSNENERRTGPTPSLPSLPPPPSSTVAT